MRPIRTLTTVAGLSLCVACGVGTNADNTGLKFELAATCTPLASNTGGDITVTRSSGFTRHGSYTSTLTGPDGKTLTGPAGKASSTGGTPNWRWACYRQASGTYKVTITDETTGKQATDSFEVE